MKSLFTRCLLGLVLAAQTWGQAWAQLPSLGGDEDLPVMIERKIGDRIAREIYRDPDYLDDPVLVDYVQSIWDALLGAAKKRGDLSPDLEDRFAWRLFIAKDPTVNAFALPGGYMGIHTGLIALSSHRAEIAAVLAHELSHVTQRHIARGYAQQNRQQPLILAAMLLGAATITKNPELANAAIVGGQAAAIQAQLNYTRDMEREADRVGYGILTQANFEAAGMVSMFELLGQANRINDNGNFPYLRTHPLTGERIAEASSRVSNDRAPATLNKDPLALMMAIRAKILSGTGVDTWRSVSAQAQALEFAEWPLERKLSALYGATLASHKLRESTLAQEQYVRLVRLLQTPVQISPEVAHVIALLGVEIGLHESGQAVSAPTLAAHANALSLNASSSEFATFKRSATLWFAQAQLALGQARAVAEDLPTWLTTHGRDAQAWRLLAQAHRAQQQEILAIRADAEALSAEMDYAGALDRLRAAQKLPDARNLDHFDQSILQSRIRHISDLRRSQIDDEKLLK